MKFMSTIRYGLTLMFLFPLAGIICGGTVSDMMQQTSASDRIYPTGKEPPPLKQKSAKPAKLFQSPNMKGVVFVDYAIQVIVDTDENIQDNSSSRSSDGSYSSRSSSGSVKYIPRIGITAKNNPLPKSCLLVIEYFSRTTAGKAKSRKECVEHIDLPEVDKGKAVTVDAEGVEFYKWEHKSNSAWGYNYKHSGGLELYGVIVSIFKDDKVLIQVCMPQSLLKECNDTVSPPQAYEDSQSRRFYGW